MRDVFSVVLTTHIVGAVLCLVAFWIPVFSHKGGRVHVVTGKVYLALLLWTVMTAWALTAIAFTFETEARPAGTGMPLDAVADDRGTYRLLLGALASLALVTLAMAISGMRALKLDRGSRPAEKIAFGAIIAVGIGLAGLGIREARPEVIVVGLAAVAAAAFGFRVAAGRRPAFRVKDHATGLLLSGIGLHSTVAVVVGNRMVPDFAHGPYGALIWALPTLIGVPLLIAFRRR